MTDEIERRAEELIDTIDQMGGALEAVLQGFQAARIAESAYRHELEVERGERVIVGVNRFVDDQAVAPEVLRVDPEMEVRRRAQVKALRAARDAERVDASLNVLTEAARGDANLMPVLVAAVEADTTLGEICAALRTVFGEYRAPGAG